MGQPVPPPPLPSPSSNESLRDPLEADAATAPVSPRELRLFAGQLRRILENSAARLRCSAISLGLSSGQDCAVAVCDAEGRTLFEVGSPILGAAIGVEVAALHDTWPKAAQRDSIVAVSDPTAGGLDTLTLTFVTPLPAELPGGSGGYLALRVRHPQLPFGTPAPNTAPPPPPDDELMALPPAVGPRYNGFQAPPPAPALSGPRTVDDEGPRLPPTLLDEGLLRQLARRVRASRDRLGDLLAQREALRYGVDRLRALIDQLGAGRYGQLAAALLAHSEAAARAACSSLPDGFYAFADSLDDDGSGRTDVAICATCILKKGQLQIDLRESEDAVLGPLNTVAATVRAAVRHVLGRFVPADVVRNDGLLAPVTLLLRPGSLLAAEPPFPLALGVDETAWRIADVIAGALAQAAPPRARAADCGTTSSLYLNWASSGLSHRERLPGGAGGGPGPGHASLCGASLPAELLERRFPLRVLRHAVLDGSGGNGVHPGSDGEVREFELLGEAAISLAGERRRRPPYGLAGGGPGTVGRDTVQPAAATTAQALPAKAAFSGHVGDRLSIESPGGGGHGDAQRAAFFAALLT